VQEEPGDYEMYERHEMVHTTVGQARRWVGTAYSETLVARLVLAQNPNN